jgi:threonine synthase
MPSFVSHLESAIDGTHLNKGQILTLHKDRPLWVRYNLNAVSEVFTKEVLMERPATMWRYRELLPPERDDSIVSLGEGMTPLIGCARLGKALGISNLFIKDESQMPTGSFKSRGLSAAITMAREFGIKRVAIPTAGNAGGALAAYAARANMEAFVFMPKETPEVNKYEAALAGARVFLVDGLITDCAKIVRAGIEKMGWFDLSTLKEPYRIEGKKTMGLELAEQFNWKLPDVILYPTGGGTGLIGMWKAFSELNQLGWLESDRLPRMVSVQSDGCDPIVNAYRKGKRFAEPFENAATIASGLRVPSAVGDFMILDAVRQSKGCALSVDENKIPHWMKLAASNEGILICPESAVCVGAAEKLTQSGWIKPNERVVIFNCGAAQKYVEVIKADLPTIDKNKPIDWELISQTPCN